MVNEDTDVANPDYGYDAGQCPGETAAWGAGSNDWVYEFAAPTAGTYTFTLDASFDSNLYASSVCGDLDTCIAANETGGVESIDVPMAAGETVFIYVDGYGSTSNQSGTYTLSVDEPCVPTCEGLECGDDGCGGSCGTCGEGTFCGPGVWWIPDEDTCDTHDCRYDGARYSGRCSIGGNGQFIGSLCGLSALSDRLE